MGPKTANAADLASSMPRGTARLLLRPEEAADSIGVSRARFYQLLSHGDIKSIKVGRSRRIPLVELQRWLDEELARQSA